MRVRSFWSVFLLVFAGVAGINSYAGQVLFYTGPDCLCYSTNGLPSIADPYATTDTFSLGFASTVTGISFSEWVTHGDTPGSLTWEITTSPNSGILAQGTVTPTYVLTQGNVMGNDVYWSSFSVDVPLASGSYWLLLEDASAGWGFSNPNAGVTE